VNPPETSWNLPEDKKKVINDLRVQMRVVLSSLPVIRGLKNSELVETLKAESLVFSSSSSYNNLPFQKT